MPEKIYLVSRWTKECSHVVGAFSTPELAVKRCWNDDHCVTPLTIDQVTAPGLLGGTWWPLCPEKPVTKSPLETIPAGA